MFYRFIKILKRIVENPYLNIVIGLILLYSGIVETVNELKEIEEFNIGVHHGVVLFAILHILKTIPDLFEGLEYLDIAREEKKNKT